MVLFDGPITEEAAKIALLRMIDISLDGMDDDQVDEPAGVGFATDEIEPGVLLVTVSDEIEGGADHAFLIRIEKAGA